jgi:Flp pilus assembly protein TadD
VQGTILLLSERFEEALRAFNRFGVPNSTGLPWRAVTLVRLGRIDEARADIQRLLAIRPGASVSELKQFLEGLLKLDLDALRQAGLPE